MPNPTSKVLKLRTSISQNRRVVEVGEGVSLNQEGKFRNKLLLIGSVSGGLSLLVAHLRRISATKARFQHLLASATSSGNEDGRGGEDSNKQQNLNSLLLLSSDVTLALSLQNDVIDAGKGACDALRHLINEAPIAFAGAEEAEILSEAAGGSIASAAIDNTWLAALDLLRGAASSKQALALTTGMPTTETVYSLKNQCSLVSSSLLNYCARLIVDLLTADPLMLHRTSALSHVASSCLRALIRAENEWRLSLEYNTVTSLTASSQSLQHSQNTVTDPLDPSIILAAISMLEESIHEYSMVVSGQKQPQTFSSQQQQQQQQQAVSQQDVRGRGLQKGSQKALMLNKLYMYSEPVMPSSLRGLNEKLSGRNSSSSSSSSSTSTSRKQDGGKPASFSSHLPHLSRGFEAIGGDPGQVALTSREENEGTKSSHPTTTQTQGDENTEYDEDGFQQDQDYDSRTGTNGTNNQQQEQQNKNGAHPALLVDGVTSNSEKKRPTVVRPTSAAARLQPHQHGKQHPNHPKPFYLFVASRSPEPVLLSSEIQATSSSRSQSPSKSTTAKEVVIAPQILSSPDPENAAKKTLVSKFGLSETAASHVLQAQRAGAVNLTFKTAAELIASPSTSSSSATASKAVLIDDGVNIVTGDVEVVKRQSSEKSSPKRIGNTKHSSPRSSSSKSTRPVSASPRTTITISNSNAVISPERSKLPPIVLLPATSSLSLSSGAEEGAAGGVAPTSTPIATAGEISETVLLTSTSSKPLLNEEKKPSMSSLTIPQNNDVQLEPISLSTKQLITSSSSTTTASSTKYSHMHQAVTPLIAVVKTRPGSAAANRRTASNLKNNTSAIVSKPIVSSTLATVIQIPPIVPVVISQPAVEEEIHLIENSNEISVGVTVTENDNTNTLISSSVPLVSLPILEESITRYEGNLNDEQMIDEVLINEEINNAEEKDKKNEIIEKEVKVTDEKEKVEEVLVDEVYTPYIEETETVQQQTERLAQTVEEQTEATQFKEIVTEQDVTNEVQSEIVEAIATQSETIETTQIQKVSQIEPVLQSEASSEAVLVASPQNDKSLMETSSTKPQINEQSSIETFIQIENTATAQDIVVPDTVVSDTVLVGVPISTQTTISESELREAREFEESSYIDSSSSSSSSSSFSSSSSSLLAFELQRAVEEEKQTISTSIAPTTQTDGEASINTSSIDTSINPSAKETIAKIEALIQDTTSSSDSLSIIEKKVLEELVPTIEQSNETPPHEQSQDQPKIVFKEETEIMIASDVVTESSPSQVLESVVSPEKKKLIRAVASRRMSDKDGVPLVNPDGTRREVLSITSPITSVKGSLSPPSLPKGKATTVAVRSAVRIDNRPKGEPKTVIVMGVEPSTAIEPAAVTEPMSVEPVSVEPVSVEPVAVEPVSVEPVAVEPVSVEPVSVEPVSVEPVSVEPVSVEPVSVEPVSVEPVSVEPVSVEPVSVEPVSVEPVAVEPVSVEPVAVEPVSVEPVAVEPVSVEPVAVEPVSVEPVLVEPVSVEPVAVEPVSVEPVSVEPVAVEPVSVEPVSVEPVAVEPVLVEPVAVEPVAVEPVLVETTSSADDEFAID
jgi:hypothetical protein